MGTTTLQISLGEGLMVRFCAWRTQMGFPPEKTHDAFAKEMLIQMMNKEVPDVKKE